MRGKEKRGKKLNGKKKMTKRRRRRSSALSVYISTESCSSTAGAQRGTNGLNWTQGHGWWLTVWSVVVLQLGKEAWCTEGERPMNNIVQEPNSFYSIWFTVNKISLTQQAAENILDNLWRCWIVWHIMTDNAQMLRHDRASDDTITTML